MRIPALECCWEALWHNSRFAISGVASSTYESTRALFRAKLRVKRRPGERPRVALIAKGEVNRFTRHFPHPLGQLRHLRSILLIGRRDDQRQQMPERVGGDVRLAVLPALRPVVTGAGARL